MNIKYWLIGLLLIAAIMVSNASASGTNYTYCENNTGKSTTSTSQQNFTACSITVTAGKTYFASLDALWTVSSTSYRANPSITRDATTITSLSQTGKATGRKAPIHRFDMFTAAANGTTTYTWKIASSSVSGTATLNNSKIIIFEVDSLGSHHLFSWNSTAVSNIDSNWSDDPGDTYSITEPNIPANTPLFLFSCADANSDSTSGTVGLRINDSTTGIEPWADASGMGWLINDKSISDVSSMCMFYVSNYNQTHNRTIIFQARDGDSTASADWTNRLFGMFSIENINNTITGVAQHICSGTNEGNSTTTNTSYFLDEWPDNSKTCSIATTGNVTLFNMSFANTDITNKTIWWINGVLTSSNSGSSSIYSYTYTNGTLERERNHFDQSTNDKEYFYDQTIYNTPSNTNILTTQAFRSASSTAIFREGETLYLPLTWPNAVTSSCTYSGSGNWLIQCSDACNLTTNTNINGNNLTFNGTGTIRITANITGVVKEWTTGGCKRWIAGGSIKR